MPTCENCLDHHYGTEGEPCGRCKHVAELEAENARLSAALEEAVRNHPRNDGIGNGGNDWTVSSNDSWAKARIEVQASQLKSQQEEIAKLRAALEAAAEAFQEEW